MSAAREPRPGELYGLLAEFDTPGALAHAAAIVRDQGFARWDCHSPFPVHGLDQAMGLRRTAVPWFVFIAGTLGCGTGVWLQWWTNAHDYRLIVSDKPFWSLPANIPVVFELTVLFSALVAFAALFAFNRLPRFFHPVFQSERFRRVTNDGFFITIESTDPRFDVERTEALLRSAGARHVERHEA